MLQTGAEGGFRGINGLPDIIDSMKRVTIEHTKSIADAFKRAWV